jgi:hypothetical protein
MEESLMMTDKSVTTLPTISMKWLSVGPFESHASVSASLASLMASL